MSDAQEREITQAAFRSRATGEVIATGPCHDLTRLPSGMDADLGEWQAGFTDAGGRFTSEARAASSAASGC